MSDTVALSEQAILDQLLHVAERIAMGGDFGEVTPLLELTTQHKGEASRARALAETFARMVVQLEAREFRLECVIEDLLQVKSELELANHDPLTGLPNRIIFRDRLRHGLAQAQRSGRKLAVLFLDLDRFKWVNDNLGHEAGDELLCQVCARLRLSVRETDTLARIGGDEFTCVLPEMDNTDTATDIAERFLSSLTAPFTLAAGEAQIGTSIGIALYPIHHEEPDTLLKYADQAMYQAKHGGRNRFVLYSPS
jgi:diguanylate cyclase (GGDEF)-like protein